MSDSRFDFDEAVLRDDLALDRTVLANERTLLAYMRTALFLLVTGLSPLKLFPENGWIVTAGCLVVALSIAVMWYGVHRYRHIQKKVNRIRRSVEGDKPIV